jgi:hypothetical protein
MNTTGSESASENYKTPATGRVAAATQGGPTAEQLAARGDDEDEPQRASKRRKGESDKESGRAVWRYPFWRAALRNGGRAWRRTSAAFKGAQAIIVREEPDHFAAATGYLADTLDWLSHFNASDDDIDADFGAQQDQYFPQL